MADLEYQRQTFSTLHVSDTDRPDYWIRHVRMNHGELRFDFGEHRDFVGQTEVQRCGPYQLVEFESRRIRYVRTAAHVREDDDRSARLVIPLQGRIALAQGEEAALLTPGQMGMVSLDRPLSLAHEDNAHAWILTVPAEDIPPELDNCGVPLTLDPQSAILGTVRAMTRELALHRETMSEWEFVEISGRLVDLLGKSIHERQAPHQDRLASIAKDAATYVRKYSDDPTITPLSVADHLGCSRRQLELALRTTNTPPARLIREARLQQARRRLQDPLNVSTVDSIAFESGFRSLSAFRDAFEKRYGIQPSQVRMAYRRK
ncbi:AraC family transcriptional regulator [Nocardia colli]|uniref:AraC family transcriptional regulator n=1 Tax=Nocardia colli TaxID=2545717 RepID=UPI00168D3122|nr:AraC family transcriptional regulator [Nocardia colli]